MRKQMRPQLVILIGNIGSGKSTISKKYSQEGFLVVCRDSLRSMVGGPGGYIYDRVVEGGIHAASVTLFGFLVRNGKNIVVDETNMSRHTRSQYIKYALNHGYEIVAHQTADFTKEQCVRNREKDNLRGYTKELWGSVWDKFNLDYQEPTPEEGFDKIIKEDIKYGI